MGHDVLIAQLDTVRVVDIHRMGVGARSNLERRELFMLFLFSHIFAGLSPTKSRAFLVYTSLLVFVVLLLSISACSCNGAVAARSFCVFDVLHHVAASMCCVELVFHFAVYPAVCVFVGFFLHSCRPLLIACIMLASYGQIPVTIRRDPEA